MVNMGEVFAHRRIHNLDMDRVPMDSKERDSSLLRDGDLLFARQSLVLSGAGKCVLFQGDKEDVTFESHSFGAASTSERQNQLSTSTFSSPPLAVHSSSPLLSKSPQQAFGEAT